MEGAGWASSPRVDCWRRSGDRAVWGVVLVRTLSRQLVVPDAAREAGGEATYSLALPRRRTRRLLNTLAIVAGVGVGLGYSRFFLPEHEPLTTVAVAAVGAILGFVLVLMPGVVVRFVRKLLCRVALARRTVALRALLERARRELDEALAEEPEDAEAWNALGVVEHLRGEEQRAAHCLEKACELDGESYETNLAAALAEVREFERAAEMLVAGTRSERNAEVAHHNLEVFLSRRPPAGIVDYVLGELETLAAPAILNSLGIYELTSGRLDLAEQHFTRAAEADPISAAPKANLAIVIHRRGRLREAMQKLADAAYLDPLNPALVNDLGALMCAGGQPVRAAEQLSRASFLAPGSAAVELNRGCVHIALGHFGEALDCFNHPSVRGEYSLEAAHDASLALIGMERYEDAAKQAHAGLENAGEDAGLRTNLGCLAWALDDPEGMQVEMRRAAELAPDDFAAAMNLAIADLVAGSEQESLERLEALEERYPSDLTVAFHLGLAYLADSLRLYRRVMGPRERQDFFRALHRCTRHLDAVAGSRVAHSMEARINLALYRYLRRDYEDARAGFEAAVKAHPEDAYLRFALGTCLAEQAMAVQRAHGAAGDELVGRTRELLKRARHQLEQAAELGEITPAVFCNLGICTLNLEDTEAAKVAFRKMLQLEDSEEAANNLALVHAKEAQRLQRSARAAGLVSRERQSQLQRDMGAAISTALHYFLKALAWNRANPILHSNIGLAYMIRNRQDDVEAALRHWQRMRETGGAWSERRYRELTALVDAKQEAKAVFDETVMGLRPIEPHECLTTVPPTPAGPRYAIQTITEEIDWRLHSDNPMVGKALRLRERTLGLRQRLARLSL